MTFESRAPVEDRKRLSQQCAKILELLRQGPQKNTDLVRIAMNLTARASEIRKAGFDVRVRRIAGGVWEYRLIED